MSRKTRKLMWSVPLIAAVAVIGALAAFMTLQPNEAEAQQMMELPGMVQNLMVVAHEAGTPQEELVITWDPPTDGGPVTSYRVDASEDGERWLAYITDHLDSDLRIVHPGLKAETPKHFRVFAFNNAGVGPGTSAMGTTTASWVPERPENLAASDNVATTNFAIDLDRDGDITSPDVDNVDETVFRLDLDADGFANDKDHDDLADAGPTGSADTDGWPGATQTVIQLTWDAPENPPGAPVTSYRVEYSGEGDGDRWHLLADEAPCPAETGVEGKCLYQHIGLRADTTNEYRVYANNSVGRGPVSDGDSGSTAASTAPEAVEGMVIGLSPDGTDVHLRWDPPDDPHGDWVSHYRVQARIGTDTEADDFKNLHDSAHIDRMNVYNFGGRDIENAEIDIPETDGRVDLPDAGLVIDLRITAINRVNTGASSNDTIDATYDAATGVWTAFESVPVGHANAPRKLDAPDVKQDQDHHQGRSAMDIDWDKAEFITNVDPDNLVVADTEIRYILVIDGADLDADDDDAADELQHIEAVLLAGVDTPAADLRPGYDHNSLRAEKEFTYSVYALNNTVNGLVTNASVRSFPSSLTKGTTADPKKPGMPRNLSVVSDGHTEIKVTWERPETREAEKLCDLAATDIAAGDAAVEDDGSECPDETADQRTNDTSVESVITGYKIEMSETGTSGWMVLEANYGDGKKFEYSATMLQPDERYYFRVSAVNSQGSGESTSFESADTDDPGMPTPPGGLVAQADGFDTLKICWYEQNIVDPLQGDAALDEGLPILGYKISYVDDNDEEVVLVENTMSDATQWMETGLLAGTTRTYRVRAITLGGVGSDYAEASATTDPADAPGMPTGVTANAMSDTEITVTWSSPASNGGADVTGYMVQSAYEMSDGTMSEWMDVDPAHTGMTMSYMDTGLMEMTKYYYRVAAMNAAGMGEYSDGMAMATTQAADTTLTAPTNVMASSDEAGTLTLTWEGGENADFYLLIAVDLASVGTDSLDYDRSRINDGMATTGDVTGLNSGSEYLGIVIALKSDGTFLHGTAGTITVD